MSEGHLHVTAVETSDPDGGTTRWSLVQVIEAAELTPTVCARCSVATLGVEGDWQRLPICSDARGSTVPEPA
jgi:hypothetical protein